MDCQHNIAYIDVTVRPNSRNLFPPTDIRTDYILKGSQSAAAWNSYVLVQNYLDPFRRVFFAPYLNLSMCKNEYWVTSRRNGL